MFALVPLQLQTRIPMPGTPWANWLLIGVNVGFYLLDWLLGWQWSCGRGSSFASVLLYGFSHAGFWHLAANLWCLKVFGDAVNRRIGNRYYLAIYLSCLVAIGIVAWLTMPGRIIGASGGVFAIISIALLLLPTAHLRIGYIAVFPITILAGLLKRPDKLWEWAIQWGRFAVPMLWCMVLIPLLEVGGLLTNEWRWTSLGHLFGLGLGVVAVLLLPERITMRRPSAAF